MHLLPTDARSYVTHFQNELNRMMASLGRANEGADTSVFAWAPTVDVKEEPDRFLIHADLPGVDAKDIEITLQDGALTISGKRQSEKKEEKSGYVRTERASGEFFRRLMLPDTADAENISARTDKGVLEISIPKREVAKAKRIEVKA